MSSIDSNALKERVFLKRVALFFGNAVGNVAVAMITAVITVVIMFDAQVPFLPLFVWLFVLILFVALVLVIETRFDEDELTITNAQFWLNLRIGSGGLVSLMYGVAVFIYPDDVQAHHVMYLVMILIALVALCATGFAAMPIYTYLVSLVTILPMLFYLLFKGTIFYAGLTFSMLVIWAILINKARQVSVTAIQALVVNEKLRAEVHNHEQTRKQLSHMVNHDFLTGLPNRKLLFEEITKLLMNRRQYHLGFSVMFLDLDGFKKINDERGHDMGDWLLQQIAERILSVLSDAHLAARIGGDEFIIVIPHEQGVKQSPAIQKLKFNIISQISQPVLLPDQHQVQVGASAGVIDVTDEYQSAEAIVKAADKAMYEHKKSKNKP